MLLEIDERERAILVDLIESRIRDLHPMIRRSRTSECRDGLKEDLHALENLRKRFATETVASDA